MDRDIFLLALSCPPSREKFFSTLGVIEDTLGGQIFGSVFEVLFSGSVDLKREFENYYSVEYPTFKDFLEIQFDLSPPQSDLEKKHLFLVKNVPSILDPSYEDNKLEEVLQALRILESAYEAEA